jgi:hypothetical protein
VALPFVAADDGIALGQPTEYFIPTAVAVARRPGHIGVVAGWTGVPGQANGEAKVIRSFGDLPDHLSSL